MQIFECPFCGPRGETEFRFTGEAGKVRPQPAAEVTADDWARYAYFTRNPRGRAREIWTHLVCGELFFMNRDTQSMAVLSTEPIRKEQP